MWKGRTVMAYDKLGGKLLRVVKVGLEDPAAVLREILLEHPELATLHLEVDGVIEPTAVAYSELRPGQVLVEKVA